MSRRLLALLAATLAAACARSERPAEAPPTRVSIRDSAFKTPESVLYDIAGDGYLVSNINGGPGEKDNNGFISHLGPDGTIHSATFIAGGANGVTLHAPKGMAIKGDTLFVADIDVIRMFHRTSGAPLGERAVRGATFLNDISVGPDGTLYFTDTGMRAGPQGFTPSGTDAVYRFDRNGRAVAVARGKELGAPNGILADSGGITVVTFGTGEVYRLDPATGARTPVLKPPMGQLDGVERASDGSLLVSSWEGQAVYRLNLTGDAYSTAVDSVQSPADIGYDRKRGTVLIPLFMGNGVEIRQIDQPRPEMGEVEQR